MVVHSECGVNDPKSMTQSRDCTTMSWEIYHSSNYINTMLEKGKQDIHCVIVSQCTLLKKNFQATNVRALSPTTEKILDSKS